MPRDFRKFLPDRVTRSCEFSFEKRVTCGIVGTTMAGKKKNPHAVALGKIGGRKGGLIGGKRRAEKLSPEERSESARKAVNARWARWRERRGR